MGQGKQLDKITWFSDEAAARNGEPGIRHSYMASLATALNYICGEVDPVWLMGSSGFAFRISVSEILCPSAMSVFDWRKILPEALEQYGRRCTYVSRLWHEEELEEERRREAHEAIRSAIDRNVPAIVWDVADCEWGLITGYDDDASWYNVLTHKGQPSCLPYDRLGRNGIDILSVAIPGLPNQRGRDEVVISSLRGAVAHADQRE